MEWKFTYTLQLCPYKAAAKYEKRGVYPFCRIMGFEDP